jgi:hypothetical protein
VVRGGAALVLGAEGNLEAALRSAEEAVDALSALGTRHEAVKKGFVEGLEATLQLGRVDAAEELIGRIDAMRPGELSAFLDGQRSRFRARISAARGRDRENDPTFKAAERLFRGYGLVFWLAVTQAEHGDWLIAQGGGEEAEQLLGEAGETFERLGAKPYLERLAGVRAEHAAEPVIASS